MTKKITHITSAQNERIRSWKKLSTSKERSAQGVVLIEGEHLVQEALRSGISFANLIVDDESKLTDSLNQNSSEITILTPKVFKSLSEVQSPQGIAALIRLSDLDLPMYSEERLLVLDGVQDPGNVGTLIRTAEAAGWNGVILGSGCADPFSPRVVRGTQGSLFRVPVMSTPLPNFLSDWAERNGGRILAATMNEGFDYRSQPFDGPLCLVLGNEGQGISESALKRCTGKIHIPMPGKVESLSVSVAGGILMFALTKA